MTHLNPAFRDAGIALLFDLASPLGEDRFWDIVAAIAWELTPEEEDQSAFVLAKCRVVSALLPLSELVAARSRLDERISHIQRRLRNFEETTGCRLPLPGGHQIWTLAEHVVGLGRAQYEAIAEAPARAQAVCASPALAAELLFSLRDVFSWAAPMYDDEALLATLEPQARRSWPGGPPEKPLALLHPVFGLGVADPEERGALRVRFVDEERVLSGSEARWAEPEAASRAEAERALLATAIPMTDERCWTLVERLEWGRGDRAARTPDVAALALSLDDALGLSESCSRLVRNLQHRVETWEDANGLTLPLSDDRLEYMLWHVVGLGPDVYANVFVDPSSALQLSPIEGFRDVVRAAWQHHVATDEALADAVRGRQALVSARRGGA